MTTWSKRTLDWLGGDTAYVSVPFTWTLPKAYSTCVWYKGQGYSVRAGGPAISLMPEYLAGIAQIGGEVNALPRHNPEATVTTRGCIRQCSFCAVPKIEGNLRELPAWNPARVICDNNILAASLKHFDRVIESVKHISGVDFNQGLDVRLLTPEHIAGLQKLDKPHIRFAWDDVNDEAAVADGINRMVAAGFPRRNITVFVLIGNPDTPEDALYRLVILRDVFKVMPFPMRYQPLFAMKFNDYVAPGWTEKELKRMMRYWARLRFTANIPYSEWH